MPRSTKLCFTRHGGFNDHFLPVCQTSPPPYPPLTPHTLVSIRLTRPTLSSCPTSVTVDSRHLTSSPCTSSTPCSLTFPSVSHSFTQLFVLLLLTFILVLTSASWFSSTCSPLPPHTSKRRPHHLDTLFVQLYMDFFTNIYIFLFLFFSLFWQNIPHGVLCVNTVVVTSI